MSNLSPPQQKTVPLVTRIEELVRDIPGWSPTDQLYTLHTLALGTASLSGDIVEIGAWCGRSTVVLGHAARQIGNTHVHSIDLFPEKGDWKQNPDGSYYCDLTIGDQSHRAYKEQTIWQAPFEAQMAPIYETHGGPFACFQKQIQLHELQSIVHPHRGTSESFCSALPSNFLCKLAFIDGDHGYDAVSADILRIKDFLVPGGWICFDDAFSSYDGVDRAIREFVIGNSSFDLAQQMTRKLFVARKCR